MIQYLTERQIILIHSLVIDETSGLHGIRDIHVLESVVASPSQVVFGKELYSTIFAKAAVYAHGIIMNHPFLDGNKRTGVAAAGVFLENNQHHLIVSEDIIAKSMVQSVVERWTIKHYADWLKKYARKI